ncbi:hypothetical protein ACFE04_001746 [Oxalis oulophora]
MATKSIISLFLLSLLLSITSTNAHILKTCAFDGMYQLGDSIADTGNLIRETPFTPFGRLPYGEDFPQKSTGRCSNGLLMIDYIALSAGIPLLDAYLNPNGTFYRGHGVNFAVAGCTALPVQELAAERIFNPVTNSSLRTQLDQFFTHLNSICYDPRDCSEKLKSALFMVGEIGGNDINYALLQGKTIEEVKTLVPRIVQAIKSAVSEVIINGAFRIVVPGNFPIGCLPIYLTSFQTSNSSAYDELHCLKDLNNLASYQNELLQQAISELRIENPNSIIVYGDYFNSYKWILENAKLLGYDESLTQKACCGVGGDYNFSLTRLCGSPGVPVCSNPNKSMSWDGIHSTQKTYQFMTSWILHDIFPKLHCIA